MVRVDGPDIPSARHTQSDQAVVLFDVAGRLIHPRMDFFGQGVRFQPQSPPCRASALVDKGPREEIFYFAQGGELNAVRWNDWKVHFAITEGNIATGVRTVRNWPVIINLKADPYEKMWDESEMYIRWYGDNIWLFVPIQDKLKKFFATLNQFPFQKGSSLNAAGINYQSLKAMQVLKELEMSGYISR